MRDCTRADTVPALVIAVPSLPEEERREVAALLLDRWSPPQSFDWRAWCWGRMRARESVGVSRSVPQAAAGRE